MGMKYRILDYANGKILNNLSLQEVCITLRSLFPAYTQSFAIVSLNDEFVTGDFKQNDFGDWIHSPVPRRAE